MPLQLLAPCTYCTTSTFTAVHYSIVLCASVAALCFPLWGAQGPAPSLDFKGIIETLQGMVCREETRRAGAHAEE